MDYWKAAGSLSEENQVCPQCGVKTTVGGKFCLSCGYRLAAEATEPATEPPVSKPEPITQTPPVVKHPPQNTTPIDPVPVPKAQERPAVQAAPGAFFEQAKRRIKTGHIKNATIALLFSALFGFIVLSTGFSADMEWQIGLRYSDLGIPLPNWLISTVALLFCVGIFVFFIASIRGFLVCQEYDNLLAAAETIGNIQAVGQHLQTLPASTLNKKGELRFDKDIFFYQKGEEVWLFPTKSISNIRPVQKNRKTASEYYVEISGPGKSVEIVTKKKNALPLANELLTTVKQSVAG